MGREKKMYAKKRVKGSSAKRTNAHTLTRTPHRQRERKREM